MVCVPRVWGRGGTDAGSRVSGGGAVQAVGHVTCPFHHMVLGVRTFGTLWQSTAPCSSTTGVSLQCQTNQLALWHASVLCSLPPAVHLVTLQHSNTPHHTQPLAHNPPAASTPTCAVLCVPPP